MKIKDVMTKHTITVGQDEPVTAAARLLKRDNIGAVPVCDDTGHLQGILTDLDKNGYTNTLCISGQGAAYKQELQEEFRHYLMNVKETHTGNLNLKDAYACLQEQRKALNRKGLENELQSVSHRMEELSLEAELERIG